MSLTCRLSFYSEQGWIMTEKPSSLQIHKASKEVAPLLVSSIEINEKFWQTHSNYLSVLWILEGTGGLETDFSKSGYSPDTIYCFNNYQAFNLQPEKPTRALLLLFHPNFFCIETYQHEVGCNGVLFNQIYDTSPIVILPDEAEELHGLLRNIQTEATKDEIATGELVFSYLKIFLVKLTRYKTAQSKVTGTSKVIPEKLEQLIVLINEHFSGEHRPSFYADALNVSLKSLAGSCRKYFSKSISMLIQEKILLKAKWELLHTRSQVKSIAASLGFQDEYYFSRFFKKHIGLSPAHFRELEWEIRKGYLSIP